MFSIRNIAAPARCAAAMFALFAESASPVFAQAPASASDTSFTASQDWRVVIVADNGRFLHCAAITTGPAGDLRLSKINVRDWAIAVPAGGLRGNVRANVGSEQMTLQADGQRAWWVIRMHRSGATRARKKA